MLKYDKDGKSLGFDIDPRQKLCWDFFVNPKSPTFANAYQSAIKAGYSKSRALKITVAPWFEIRHRRFCLKNKAEKNLEEFLNIDVNLQSKAERAEWSRIKLDATKFVNKTLGRKHYGDKAVLTGKDGKDLFSPMAEFSAAIIKIANESYEQKINDDDAGGEKSSADKRD